MSSGRFNINLVEELTLGNFKCFSASQKLPLRPITLLYGPNGAGKSTVIQALKWLPELSNGTWRESFGRLVRDYDLKSNLTFGAKISLASDLKAPDDSDPFLLKLRDWITSKVSTFAFEAELTGNNPLSSLPLADSRSLQDWARPPLISKSNLWVNDVPLLDLKLWFGRPGIATTFFEQRSWLRVEKFNGSHPLVPLLLPLAKELALFRIRSRIDPTGLVGEGDALAADPLFRTLEEGLLDFELESIKPRELLGALEELDEKILFDAYKIPIRAELDERDRDVTYISVDHAASFSIKSPYLDMLPKGLSGAALIEEIILDQLRLLVALVVNFLADLDELTGGFSSPFFDVVHLGALRSIPSSQFVLTDPEELFKCAPDWHLPARLRGALGLHATERQIRRVNAWLESLERLDTAYKFLVSRVTVEESTDGKPPTATQHLRFKGILDRRRNVVVPLSETGTGFSQLLPIILAAFSGNGELVAVQQPELHLHPALQSELGDLFIAQALGERCDDTKWNGTNQFVLETHSEHLLLRIMRRIRETSRGTLPNHIPPVHPDDVSLLYIDNVGETTVVRPMPLSKDGQLLYDWPGGFFEEGLREVLM